jgi:TolB-like protein
VKGSCEVVQIAGKTEKLCVRMRRLALARWGFQAAATLLLVLSAHASAAQSPASPPAPLQTLCVLDFQRLGDDSRADWLEQGLADLMIGTMGAISPYLVIERRHLREILQEQRLAASGLVDVDTAIQGARLARAQVLLQGSFVQRGDRLTIQVRLIRVSDQHVLARTTWSGAYGDVLSAPQALAEDLLTGLARPLDPGNAGIERLAPVTVDEARSYFLGVRAFDDGRYTEALAHYLDAARQAGSSRRAHSAALEMYYLLDRSDHAVLYARDLARSFETRRDLPAAVEYYSAAAQESLGPANDLRSARTLLQKALTLVGQHDRASGQIARTKRSVAGRIDELQRMGPRDTRALLSDPDIRHRIWVGDIESELTRRADEQARGGLAVFDGGKWIKRPVPQPTLLMWKIRALNALARVHAQLGEIRPALDRYQELLEEYEFLTSRLPVDGPLLTSLKTEAHFMMLRHYASTGQLVRDHRLNAINRLNLVSNGEVFVRDFRDARPDGRARVASRHEGRGYEYFDFAAPPGYQIDAVTLRIAVEGIAELSLDLPQPSGRPPQYSLSRRLSRFRFSEPGAYTRAAKLPTGTEFLSLATSWGPGLFSNTGAEMERWKASPPRGGRDVVRWDITFSMSPRRASSVVHGGSPELPLGPAVRNVIERYSAGWDRSSVVRDAQTALYSGSPRLDVYDEDWLVISQGGDIRIFQQQDLGLEIALPLTVNTREREFDPSLVRTHDGRYALLWARGTGRTTAARFVSFSEDLLRWEPPQRLVFEDSPGPLAYTYSQAEPLERTFNIVALPRGYAMLLAQGFMRRSEDLRTWGPPRKAIPQEGHQNRLIRGRDGTVWAVSESPSGELEPYSERNWLSGFFVVGGKRYGHATELRVSWTKDGVKWHPAGRLTLPGQPGQLWAFAADERRLGIGLLFNNLYTRWFAVSAFDDLAEIDVQLPFMQQSGEAACFVRDAQLTCVRSLLDPDRQKPLLLATSTGRIWGGSRQ